MRLGKRENQRIPTIHASDFSGYGVVDGEGKWLVMKDPWWGFKLYLATITGDEEEYIAFTRNILTREISTVKLSRQEMMDMELDEQHEGFMRFFNHAKDLKSLSLGLNKMKM